MYFQYIIQITLNNHMTLLTNAYNVHHDMNFGCYFLVFSNVKYNFSMSLCNCMRSCSLPYGPKKKINPVFGLYHTCTGVRHSDTRPKPTAQSIVHIFANSLLVIPFCQTRLQCLLYFLVTQRSSERQPIIPQFVINV